MNLLIKQFSPASCYSPLPLPLVETFSPAHASQTPQRESPSFTPIQSSRYSYSLILNVYVFR
jgi:hypothetical protein